MKKIIAVLMIAVMCLSLTACSKEVISVETFKEKAEAAGAIVAEDVDLSDNIYKDEIKDVVYAECDEWKANFYEVDDNDTAEDMYDDYVDYLEDSARSKSTKVTNNGVNFARFSLNADGDYSFVAFVDNTVLIIEADDENKDAVKEFAKELGYN